MILSNHKIDKNKLLSIFEGFKEKKIAVIGDLMIDHYLWGQVERISPEAPVPIVDIYKQDFCLGGAANVVNNIISLKAMPVVIGLIGDDNYSEILLSLFKEKNIRTDFIIKDNSRPTTVKSRIFASAQQVMRYDQEQKNDISECIENSILKNIDSALENADALLIEDYNKGLLTSKIIRKAIYKANELKIPVTVDPKFKNFFEYQYCTVFKPNFNELQKNLNIEILDDESLNVAAYELFKRINPDHLIITLGEKGLKIFDKNNNVSHIPTFAKEVFDVSGAGDTVISVLTLCLSVGLDIKTSAIIANHAAGAVCGKRGIHPATVNDILCTSRR
ncbi:MAG: D-glycero-beta-D-manno-heptose-7-phosphate kinase [Candidatus Cloacimonetes bacterium]|nr:D-glycero-beta-D-manno-heptose-7-phosphate kinase [Candidatus Cloacimonadota bacterium]